MAKRPILIAITDDVYLRRWPTGVRVPIWLREIIAGMREAIERQQQRRPKRRGEAR